jgi:hypothetical protein
MASPCFLDFTSRHYRRAGGSGNGGLAGGAIGVSRPHHEQTELAGTFEPLSDARGEEPPSCRTEGLRNERQSAGTAAGTDPQGDEKGYPT